MNKLKFLLLPAIFGFVTLSASGQCKSFTKRNCSNELSPYLSNGQLNSTQLLSGDRARVNLSLSKGLSYRLVVCSEKSLGAIAFDLSNESGRVHKHDTIREGKSIIDFKVAQSGNYKFSLRVPEKRNAAGLSKSGCVSVLVGFK